MTAPDAGRGLGERLDQIVHTAHRVRPTGVGEWKSANGLPLSPSDAVVIAPADLMWMAERLRARDAEVAAAKAEGGREALREDGAGLIATERARQITVEGYTPEHDAEHATQLVSAAACYLFKSPDLEKTPPVTWPWGVEDWKPSDRVRNLVKAGALIAAEIDRLAAHTDGGKS